MSDELETTLELVPPELDLAVSFSTLEHMLEYVFLADLLQEAWSSRLFGKGA